MRVLVTGGAGYIGPHVAVLLFQAGHDVVILDNFSNSLRKRLNIFGADYPTPDGIGVRDYIHVMDLAEGHLAALCCFERNTDILTVNLGTGRGHSVLEMVQSFEKASGRKIPCTIAPRRSGGVAACRADPTRAQTFLGWRASRDMDAMCADTWRWQSSNPEGYN